MDATLAAALVAAGVTLATFIVGLWSSATAAKRAAHREMLAPYIADLGAAIHECVAISSILAKRIEKGSSLERWVKEAQRAKRELDALRRKVKYPLPELDQGLRTLIRVPDWMRHVAADGPDRAARLHAAAENLRLQLDDLIGESYRSGRPPKAGALALLVTAVNAVFDEGAVKKRVASDVKTRLAEAAEEAEAEADEDEDEDDDEPMKGRGKR